jgi:hypothetical protein
VGHKASPPHTGGGQGGAQKGSAAHAVAKSKSPPSGTAKSGKKRRTGFSYDDDIAAFDEL